MAKALELNTPGFPEVLSRPEVFSWLEGIATEPKRTPSKRKVGYGTPSPQYSPRVFEPQYSPRLSECGQRSETFEDVVREDFENEWGGDDFQGLSLRDQLCEGQRYITEVERKICKYQSLLRVELNQVERRLPTFRNLLQENAMRNRMPWITSAQPSLKARYTDKLLDLQEQLGLPRRAPPREPLEQTPETPSVPRGSRPSTPPSARSKQGLDRTPESGPSSLQSPQTWPQARGQRQRQAHAMLAASALCSPERSRKDLAKAMSFAKDAHKIFSEIGDRRMQAAAHLAIMGVQFQNKMPRDPSFGDEVEALSKGACEEYIRPGDRGRVNYIYTDDGIESFEVAWKRTGIRSTMNREAWMKNILPIESSARFFPSLGDEVEAQELYRLGDRGAVSRVIYTDGNDRPDNIEVTWYRTGLTSTIKREAWKNISPTGNTIPFPRVGDELEALPGTALEVDGTDLYEGGDKGRVSKETNDPEDDSKGQFEITWYRTGQRSIIAKELWLKDFRLVGSNAQISSKTQIDELQREKEMPKMLQQLDRSSSPRRSVAGKELIDRLREKASCEHSEKRLKSTKHASLADPDEACGVQLDDCASVESISVAHTRSKMGRVRSQAAEVPGRYRIVLDKLPVTSGLEVAKLAKDTLVEVLEHSTESIEGRRRARIREPAGWISLGDAVSDFAVAEVVEDRERYRIVRDDLQVTNSVAIKCSEIAKLASNDVVDVLEIVAPTPDGRVQARIQGSQKGLDGWICLRDGVCRFAEEAGGTPRAASDQRSPRTSIRSVGGRPSAEVRSSSPGTKEFEREQQRKELERWEQQHAAELAREKEVFEREQKEREEMAKRLLQEKQRQQDILAQRERERERQEEQKRQERERVEAERSSQGSAPGSADSQNEGEEEEDYDYDEDVEEEALEDVPQSTHRRQAMCV